MSDEKQTQKFSPRKIRNYLIISVFFLGGVAFLISGIQEQRTWWISLLQFATGIVFLAVGVRHVRWEQRTKR